MANDQHLLPNESHLEYKKRVLDTKSNSFCGAKWYYATIWLYSGMTTSCHHPLPHFVSVNEVSKNYKSLSNTPQKKLERTMMQKGERPTGCDYCWRVEDLGPEQVSDRVYKSILYNDKDLQIAYEDTEQKDFNLKYLELSFDRTCNFSCSYCNPSFSSSWVKDIKTHGPYTNLGQDANNHYGHQHNNIKIDEEDNPYIDAFFKWWESDLHKTLTHLRLTGGEPLMSKHTWKLLEWFNEKDSDIYFAINSNLGCKPEIIERLLQYTSKLKNFHVYTSNESVNYTAEYIRDGLDWNLWQKNCETLIESKILAGFHSMCTINAVSITGLEDYLNWCTNIKRKYGKDYPTFTLNILRFPNFQSVLILPQEIRSFYSQNLKNWLHNTDKSLLHEMEINHLERLIVYLGNEKNIINGNVKSLRSDFKNFYSQYDLRRGKNFIETFPLLEEWYNGI